MLAKIFDSHNEFVPPGESVNKEHCLVRFKEFIEYDLNFKKEETSLFRVTTKTSHCSISKVVFGKIWDSRIKSPPKFSCLSQSDVFLFPTIKFTLNARRFEDMEDIKRNVTQEVLKLHVNEFKKGFQQFYEQAQTCVTFKETTLGNIKIYVLF
jgi:hypothetical protein